MSSQTRFVSTPLTNLLDAAGIQAKAIYDALDQRIAARGPPLLRRDDPHVLAIAKATDADLISIGRRHRHLLAELEQRTANGLGWIYHEHSRNRCDFACPTQITEELKLALHGERLDRLIDAPPFLATITVGMVRDSFDGWTTATVDPGWRTF